MFESFKQLLTTVAMLIQKSNTHLKKAIPLKLMLGSWVAGVKEDCGRLLSLGPESSAISGEYSFDAQQRFYGFLKLNIS